MVLNFTEIAILGGILIVLGFLFVNLIDSKFWVLIVVGFIVALSVFPLSIHSKYLFSSNTVIYDTKEDKYLLNEEDKTPLKYLDIGDRYQVFSLSNGIGNENIPYKQVYELKTKEDQTFKFQAEMEVLFPLRNLEEEHKQHIIEYKMKYVESPSYMKEVAYVEKVIQPLIEDIINKDSAKYSMKELDTRMGNELFVKALNKVSEELGVTFDLKPENYLVEEKIKGFSLVTEGASKYRTGYLIKETLEGKSHEEKITFNIVTENGSEQKDVNLKLAEKGEKSKFLVNLTNGVDILRLTEVDLELLLNELEKK